MPILLLIFFLFTGLQLLFFGVIVKSKIKKVLFIISLIVYIGGFFIVKDAVKESCKNVTCEDGWYSPENTRERVIAIAWAFTPFFMGFLLSKEDMNFEDIKFLKKD